MYPKKDYKLGKKIKGERNTLQELHDSGMPLRITLASGKSPSVGADSKRRSVKGAK